jgi:hypothetical protein
VTDRPAGRVGQGALQRGAADVDRDDDVGHRLVPLARRVTVIPPPVAFPPLPYGFLPLSQSLARAFPRR